MIGNSYWLNGTGQDNPLCIRPGKDLFSTERDHITLINTRLHFQSDDKNQMNYQPRELVSQLPV